MVDAADNFQHVFKILLVGDTGVGKSALLLRFTQDRCCQCQKAQKHHSSMHSNGTRAYILLRRPAANTLSYSSITVPTAVRMAATSPLQAVPLHGIWT